MARLKARRATAKSQNRRMEKGSGTILIVMGFLLAVIALVALFRYMVYLGGSQEMKNSVDAGALNIAARAPLIKLPPSMVDPPFADVADTHSEVGLMNINRVWGKAYLIGANGEDILNSQFCPTDPSWVTKPLKENIESVNDISEHLCLFLQAEAAPDPLEQGKLMPWHQVFFNTLAREKPVKLFGMHDANVAGVDDDYSGACVYRGEESNLAVPDMEAIPHGSHVFTTQYQAQTFMQGYNPVQAGGHYFSFVTLHCNESPHLISNEIFEKNKTKIANIRWPVPNAFRKRGQLTGQIPLSSFACAVANPMRTYNLAIPYSYVQITIKNSALWYLQGSRWNTTGYSFDTGKVWGLKNQTLYPPAQGILNGYANLGLEYWPKYNPYQSVPPDKQPNPNLLTAIEALPGDHSIVYDKLIQRIKEFAPGYTITQLRTLLQNTPMLPQHGADDVYFIYPTYTTEDHTDPKVCASGNKNLPQWLIPRPPESSHTKPSPLPAQQIMTESPLDNKPNNCWSTIIGPYSTDKHFTQETGAIYWEPGLGLQNLGNLQIERQTTIKFTGMP